MSPWHLVVIFLLQRPGEEPSSALRAVTLQVGLVCLCFLFGGGEGGINDWNAFFLEHFEVAWNDMSNEVSPEMGNPIRIGKNPAQFDMNLDVFRDWLSSKIVDLLRYKLLGQIIGIPRWWFQTIFYVHPCHPWGFMIQLDVRIFFEMGYIGDDKLPNYIGIIINQHKDPY